MDIAVSSATFFDYEIYDQLKSDPELDDLTDKISPAIAIYGSIQNENENVVIPKIRIVGFDENSAEFGDFVSKGTVKDVSGSGEPRVILNDIAADKLEINVADELKLQLARPEYSIDTIYEHEFGANKTIEVNLNLTEIVLRSGFAQIQSSARTSILETVYLPLGYLQELLGLENKINTVFISNKGDSENGIKYDDEVISRLEILLNEAIKTDDIELDFKNIGSQDYIRYSTRNVFLPSYHESFMSTLSSVEGYIGYSPVLSYFVNYLKSESGETVWYSTVTGLDASIDNQYGLFLENSTQSWSSLEIADDEIIINNQTAEFLDVKVGDIIELNYMVLDRLYVPRNISVEFQVKYIVDMEGKAKDRWLMPDFPGIDTELDLEPLDWDTLYYINRTTVENLKGGFENKYWLKYRGTPKAYITLDKAKSLWQNDFGDLTGYKIYYDEASFSEGYNAKAFISDIEVILDEEIEYGDAGITINQVKREGFESAEALEIFPQMFLAFGAIIIAAGAIFVVNMMVTIVYNRRRELGILRAIGSRRKDVWAILTLEGMFYSFSASLLGTFLGIGVATGLASGLNGIWSNIVEGYKVPVHFTSESLFYAFIGGFFIGLIAISLASWKMTKQGITSSLREDEYSTRRPVYLKSKDGKGKRKPSYSKMFLGLILILAGLGVGSGPYYEPALADPGISLIIILVAPILTIFGLVILIEPYIASSKEALESGRVYKIWIIAGLVISGYVIVHSFFAFRDSSVPGMALFFTAGLFLLFGLLAVMIGLLIMKNQSEGDTVIPTNSDGTRGIGSEGSFRTAVNIMVLRNISRKKFRSISTIVMFSLIVFLIFALATNIMLQNSGRSQASELAGGGYDMLGESSLPLNFDLNNASSRRSYGLDSDILNTIDVTPMKSVGHEAGKCSNMNAIYPPRIYGIDNKFITENNFEFMRTKSGLSEEEVWEEFQNFEENQVTGINVADKSSRGTIPIIGDYETLIWLYGGDIGSIFEINDDYGTTHDLEVIAIINSPVFAGSFIMAETDFDTIFPISGQLKSFLITTTEPDKETAKEQLQWELREFGMALITVDEMTEDSVGYVSAYMNLFQLYLYLGLTVGIAALGILSLKAISERHHEIGVLKAIGFRNRQIFSLFILENTYICTIGIIVGAITGIAMAFLSYPFWGLSRLEFELSYIVFLSITIISIILLTNLLTFYPAYRASKFSSAEALRHTD
jgi:ABC-type lipoprotein release transport system permease subunit